MCILFCFILTGILSDINCGWFIFPFLKVTIRWWNLYSCHDSTICRNITNKMLRAFIVPLYKFFRSQEWFIELKLLDLFCLVTWTSWQWNLAAFYVLTWRHGSGAHCILEKSERQHIFNFLLNTNWVYFPILYQVTKLGQLCGRNHRAALTDTIFLVLRLVKVGKLISI